MTSRERSGFIGKEKDDESGLGDFGVRKYDFLAGRFTSPDPLWEKYASLTPYNYCNNNPLGSVDVTGRAQFVMNNDFVLDDGIDDGNVYASSDDALVFSIDQDNDAECDFINFDKLRKSSNELPDKESRVDLLDHHKSYSRGEAGGAGTLYKYFYGGRNYDQISPSGVNIGWYSSAGKEVEKAVDKAVENQQYKEDLIYYSHDHYFDGGGRPTGNDIEAIAKLNKGKGVNIQYGILIYDKTVNIFTGMGKNQQVIMSRDLFNSIGK